MRKPFNSKNSIVNAALEALAADAAGSEGGELADGGIKPVDTSGGTPPESTEQVQATDVENVDAVAALQERVAVLEDENAVKETDLIEAAGDQVQDDLDEAIDAAVALESLGELALATYRNGTASLQSNAGIAIGLEHICSSLNFPSIVAAVEEDGVDNQGNAAKNLGERALAASKQIMKSVIDFFKRIKGFLVTFFKEQIAVFTRVTQVAKDIDAQVTNLKGGLDIKDPAIKSLGLVSGDVYKDFKEYIEFSTSVMSALADESMYRSVGRLMAKDAAGEVESVFNDVTSMIAKCFPMSRDGKDGTTLETHDMMPGGVLYSFAYKKTPEGGFSCKIRATDVPVKQFETLKTISPQQARELLMSISGWSTLVDKMNKSIARLESSVNLNNADTASPEAVRTFMSVVSQLTTVLAPMVLRMNAQVSRKFFTYVKIAQQAAKPSTPTE